MKRLCMLCVLLCCAVLSGSCKAAENTVSSSGLSRESSVAQSKIPEQSKAASSEAAEVSSEHEDASESQDEDFDKYDSGGIAWEFATSINRSNFYHGGRVIGTGGHVLMCGPNGEGLYRVSADGMKAEKISNKALYNMISFGVTTYGLTREDEETTSFCSLSESDNLLNIIQEDSFDRFIIIGDTIYFTGDSYTRGYYPPILFESPIFDLELVSDCFVDTPITYLCEGDDGVFLVCDGRELEYPPFVENVTMRYAYGEWMPVRYDEDFTTSFMPYGDMRITNPFAFEFYPGGDCNTLVESNINGESVGAENIGSFNVDEDIQYLIKNTSQNNNTVSEVLVKTKDWGHRYEILLELDEYLEEGQFPSTTIYRANDSIYIYMTVYTYENMGMERSYKVIQYNLKDNTHHEMDIFEKSDKI